MANIERRKAGSTTGIAVGLVFGGTVGLLVFIQQLWVGDWWSALGVGSGVLLGLESARRLWFSES